MGHRTFTRHGLFLICLCTLPLILAGARSAYAESDRLLLVNTINRDLLCNATYNCGYTDYRSYNLNAAESVSVRYLHDSAYGARRCPITTLHCYDKNATAPAGASLDFTGGQHPERCRAVRTDRQKCCRIESMEIQCP